MIFLASYKKQWFAILDTEFWNFSSAEIKCHRDQAELGCGMAGGLSCLSQATQHGEWKTGSLVKGSCKHLKLTLKVMLPVAAPSLKTHILLWCGCVSFPPKPSHTLGWLYQLWTSPVVPWCCLKLARKLYPKSTVPQAFEMAEISSATTKSLS